MDAEYVNLQYHNVLNGFSPFIFDGKKFFAKHVSSRDIFHANAHSLLVKNELKEAAASEYDIIKDAIKKGLWSEKKDLEIKTMQGTIEKKQNLIPKLILPSQVKQIEAEIKNLIGKINELENEKALLCMNSLESRLNMEKRDYLAFLCIYKDTNARYWETYEDFLSEDAIIVNQLVFSYYETINKVNGSILRSIAKMTDARSRLEGQSFEASTTSVMLFELKKWCGWYENIYGLEDKPEDSVIMDDGLLDKWVLGRKAKQQSEKSVKSQGGAGFTGIVTQDKEDIKILGGTDGAKALKIAQKEFENG